MGTLKSLLLRRASMRNMVTMKKLEYPPNPKKNLTLYLRHMCSLSMCDLQRRCIAPSPEDLGYLSAACWRESSMHGVGARYAMLRNIAYHFQRSKHEDSLITFIYSHPDSSKIFACIQDLRTTHYLTLQKHCRTGGMHIRGTNVLKMSPAVWVSCFRSGQGCLAAMLQEIEACVDRRVLVDIDIDAKVPEFLKAC
jgi:hypothetical protein